jgi:hypothetical protein
LGFENYKDSEKGDMQAYLQGLKTKTPAIQLITGVIVIPAGFEPTTRSLEGCCSIQLSYETIFRECLFIQGCKINLILHKTRR